MLEQTDREIFRGLSPVLAAIRLLSSRRVFSFKRNQLIVTQKTTPQ